MNCPNCNTYNDNQAVYCSNCGRLLRKGSTYNPPAETRSNEVPQYRRYEPQGYPVYTTAYVPVRTGDKTKNWAGITGFVMGLLSLLVPLTRIPLGIPGLIISLMGRKSENRALAIAGIVLSIIGLIIGVVFLAAILSLKVRTGASVPFNFSSI